MIILSERKLNIYKFIPCVVRRHAAIERLVASEGYYAMCYACLAIRSRWPVGEKAIAEDTLSSYEYARDVIKDRWLPGETAISKKFIYCVKYLKLFGVWLGNSSTVNK